MKLEKKAGKVSSGSLVLKKKYKILIYMKLINDSEILFPD